MPYTLPYALYPIPYTLHPIPYALYPMPIPCPIPYALYHIPYTYTLPYTLCPMPYTLYPDYWLGLTPAVPIMACTRFCRSRCCTVYGIQKGGQGGDRILRKTRAVVSALVLAMQVGGGNKRKIDSWTKASK